MSGLFKKLVCPVLSAFLLTSAALTFSGCFGGSEDIKDGLNAVYYDGNVTYTLKFDGVASYDVYKSDSAEGPFEKVGSCKNTYENADMYAYYKFAASDGDFETQAYSYVYSTLGDSVKVFSEKDGAEEIQDYIDTLYRRTLWDEFSEERYAILFMPGNYEGVTVKPGYYTTAAGLGYLPTDVTVTGLTKLENPLGDGSLVNFWCGVENFTVEEDAVWCVSQATSMRRMNLKGELRLDGYSYSSGGFLADSRVEKSVRNVQQQQWFTRNSVIGGWDGVRGETVNSWLGPISSDNVNGGVGVDINMVFSGVEGNVPDLWPDHRTTVLEKTTVMREKPFLVFDEVKGYGLFVPSVRENSSGVSWSEDGADGEFIGIDNFYIADADRDTAETLNRAIETGKSIIFTPGIYAIESPLEVTRTDTVLYGMGLATLRTVDGNADTCVRISDVGGVKVCGLLIDAGTFTDTLMEVGEAGSSADHSDNPVTLSDLYFRMGGVKLEVEDENGNISYGKTTGADRTLVINSCDVIGDNFWLWRADHGMDGSMLDDYFDWETGLDINASQALNWAYWIGYGVGWKGYGQSNYGRNGAVINGDRVTIYGLMVEHFGEYQTIWNGEDGFMCFYQSETPYDVPEQAAWKSEWQGVSYNGFASYKVSDDVQKHTAYGIGVYMVCDKSGIALDHAIEAPSNSGISLIHMIAANIKNGPITYVCNDHGTSGGAQKFSVTSFISGIFSP